jgi:DNA-binding transcriptional regulator YdaS (Cro superfamily)
MKLSKWLTKSGLRRNFFADRIGISASHLAGICDSRVPSLRVIEAIERETKGEVTAQDFYRGKVAVE